MVNFKKILVGLLFLTLYFGWTSTLGMAAPPPASRGQGQNNTVYTVQPGDTLILIALRYNLNPAQIALSNNLTNPNIIFPGQQLTLPGVVAPTPTAAPPADAKTHVVQPGESLSTIAGLYRVPVNNLVLLNQLPNPNVIEVGQTLRLPEGPPPTPGPLLPPFEAVELSEPTIIQGRTLVIKVTLSTTATLSGLFEGYPIFFRNSGVGPTWAIVPIHALLQPNVYPILITATLPEGQEITRHVNVTVIEGPYGQEDIQLDSKRVELLNAELIQREREKLLNLWSRISPRPRWEGPFLYPVAGNPPRITSFFGTRRSYNNSQELSFHGGTDFGGGTGRPIYAPAAGTVVLAERLTVRGNSVLIDHGMGLYSGYWHQSQIVVAQGQEVQPGDLVGYIGDTGLVTGPHLHWELRLNGIAVNPMQWVRQSIP